MTLQAIKYKRGQLQILDQLLLPRESVFIDIADTQDAWNAIRKMQVRGAPAIAIVGCLSLAVELLSSDFESTEELAALVVKQLEHLVSSRPTAVNMKEAATRYSSLVKKLVNSSDSVTVESLKKRIVADTLIYGTPQANRVDPDETALTGAVSSGSTLFANTSNHVTMRMVEEFEKMFEDDIATNRAMGRYGAEHILTRCGKGDKAVSVLTHCNTGSLATAGYGTALGVIRSLAEQEKLGHAYCTETRPYNQGARLTAYELVFDKIPSTLICDNMVAMVMKKKGISAVVVGADRVVRNGDTANKIGTYQIAIAAKHHGIPFYVACPLTSFDPNLLTGEDIVIEERPEKEMTKICGVQVAAEGIKCFNPAFDVTPADLITGGIITEQGVFPASELYEQVKSKLN